MPSSEKNQSKPLLTVEQQIEHLKSRGVTFNLCSDEEAADYLAHANNYLRAACYRKLYPMRSSGERAGSYIGLDFGAFVRLSSADRVLRSALREITLDVEHFARVELLDRASGQGENGYDLVHDYVSDLRGRERQRISSGLSRRARKGSSHDEHTGDLIARYENGYPLWVFLEAVDFGMLCDLWLFCARRWNDNEMLGVHYVLNSVKSLRNAACHNSCIINGFQTSAQRAGYSPPAVLLASMGAHGIRNTKARRAKMHNLRVAQIAASLYASYRFCVRSSTRHRHAALMMDVRDAFSQVEPLCPKDGSLVSFFDFILRLVDIWLPATETGNR